MNPTLQTRTTMSGTIGLGLRTFLFSERPELRKRRVCFAHGTRKCTDRQVGNTTATPEALALAWPQEQVGHQHHERQRRYSFGS